MVRYSHPEMFLFFIPFFVVLVWYIYSGKKIYLDLERLGSKSIKNLLLNRLNYSNISLRSKLFILAIFFIILASTGPQIGTKLTELNREGVDIFIIMDTSMSMNSTDVKPSRLEKAKYELGRLINSLEGDRVGIIAFAGSSHLHCPLTEDYSAAKLFLDIMDTGLIANQGTDLSAAIKLALEHIEIDDEKYKVIILVSDGEDHQNESIILSEQVKKLGVTIHTLGLGTLAGGPIPILDKNGNRDGFKKNSDDKVITSALNEYTLSEIASKTGGKYIRVENQINAIMPLLNEINEMDKRELKSHIFSHYEDRYQIFLIIALVLLILEFIIPTCSNKENVWKGKFSEFIN